MGGQVGDTANDRRNGSVLGHCWIRRKAATPGSICWRTETRLTRASTSLSASISQRRRAIERHHTVTHVLHWALHEIVSREAVQKGSYVGPEKLTFDFSSAALTKQQVRDVEKLVNEKVAENAPVSWTEIPYAEAKKRSDIQQFFGDKYGDVVRVVQIGGAPNELNGYSMELCGGTHVRDDGRDRIVSHRARRSDRGGDSPDRSGGRKRGEGMGDKRSGAAGGKV